MYQSNAERTRHAQREAAVRETVARLGLRIVARGCAWHIYGRGVNVLVDREHLGFVADVDLQPTQG